MYTFVIQLNMLKFFKIIDFRVIIKGNKMAF